MLTVYNDGTEKNNQNQNICLAFTVADMDQSEKRLFLIQGLLKENAVYQDVEILADAAGQS